MLLSNSHSFLLRPRKNVGLVTSIAPEITTLLSNSQSFLLVRKKNVELSSLTILDPVPENLKDDPNQESSNQNTSQINDGEKRAFIKVLGVAGAGVAAATLIPNKAHALIMGSSPTTGVVGVKDSSNARINPATEETLNTLLKPTDLNFDGSGFLNVNVQTTSGSGASSFSDSGNVSKLALVDADRHIQVDVLSSVLPSNTSTETTLQTISFGGVKYALRMATVSSVDYVGEAAIGTATSSPSWRVKKIDNTSGVTITWAGSGTFNQVWDNYESLIYS